jgi:hypothetical protein
MFLEVYTALHMSHRKLIQFTLHTKDPDGCLTSAEQIEAGLRYLLGHKNTSCR